MIEGGRVKYVSHSDVSALVLESVGTDKAFTSAQVNRHTTAGLPDLKVWP